MNRLVQGAMFQIVALSKKKHPLLHFVGIQWVAYLIASHMDCPQGKLGPIFSIEDLNRAIMGFGRDGWITATEMVELQAIIPSISERYDLLHAFKDIYGTIAEHGVASRRNTFYFVPCDEGRIRGRLRACKTNDVYTVSSQKDLYGRVTKLIEQGHMSLQDACDVFAQAIDIPVQDSLLE